MLQTRTLTMGSDHYSNGTHKIRLANRKAGYLVEIILLLFHAIKSRFVFYSLSWRHYKIVIWLVLAAKHTHTHTHTHTHRERERERERENTFFTLKNTSNRMCPSIVSLTNEQQQQKSQPTDQQTNKQTNKQKASVAHGGMCDTPYQTSSMFH